MHLVRVAVGLVVALLTACGAGDNAADTDAAGPPSCAAIDGGNGSYLGLIERNGGCEGCSSGFLVDSEADLACASAYPGVGGGCEAICKDEGCYRFCEGECRTTTKEGCVSGELACSSGGGITVCDSACGTAGGCRQCAFDSECEAELGPGAVCIRHCGTCCDDAAYPCLCD